MRGRQSQVWLVAEPEAGGRLHLRADSDALLVKGLISLCCGCTTATPRRRSSTRERCWSGWACPAADARPVKRAPRDGRTHPIDGRGVRRGASGLTFTDPRRRGLLQHRGDNHADGDDDDQHRADGVYLGRDAALNLLVQLGFAALHGRGVLDAATTTLPIVAATGWDTAEISAVSDGRHITDDLGRASARLFSFPRPLRSRRGVPA